MATRSQTFIQAAWIALFIVLYSPAVHAQQQPAQPPAAPAQEKNTEKTSPQKAVESPSEQPEQGSVLVPERGNAAPEKAESEPPKEENRRYTIKGGDTLWDISNAFLKDPFLWPFIWQANRYITNPDLIYPGNILIIPSLAPIEEAIEKKPETKEKEQKEQLVEKPTTTEKPAIKSVAKKKPAPEEKKVAKKVLVLPEEKREPLIDKYTMLNAGFVNQEESRDEIIGSKYEEKSIFGYDDIVYVVIRSKKDVAIGDKFIIYQPVKKIEHPVTGKQFGSLIKVLGILQITEKGKAGVYAARITLSFDASQRGSLLTPYQEPSLIYKPAKVKAKDITGYILAVTDSRAINAQTDVVYLDKGGADGVDPGDRFLVYAKPKNRAYPREVIGEVLVFLVKEHTATAMVVKSDIELTKGERVQYKK